MVMGSTFLKRAPLPKMQLRGKVHHNGERVKVSREVRVGMELTIQQGIDKKTVVIKELSDVRGPAPVAQKLYEETEVSITRRELIASQRKLHNLARPDHRPSKKTDAISVSLDKKMINNLTNIGLIMMMNDMRHIVSHTI